MHRSSLLDAVERRKVAPRARRFRPADLSLTAKATDIVPLASFGVLAAP